MTGVARCATSTGWSECSAASSATPGPEPVRLRAEVVEARRTAPPVEDARLEQRIRFCRTADDVTLAYATTGEGPPLMKVANWMTHIDFDWHSPVWRHWLVEPVEAS